MQGNYAPVTEEVTATDLDVEGAIPPELAGRFLRNGPNPRPGEARPHWFLGDGMIHGVELRDGKADWFRNRWVRTKQFRSEGQFVDDQGNVDLTYGPANTHIIGHAGRLLALVESSFPTEVTAELDTVGTFDFDGTLTTAMTAHPKIDPETGEMVFFGYGFFPPYLTYHVVDASGSLVRSETITVKGPTMIHDFGVSAKHVVWMDMPVVFDLALAMSGGMPYRWDETYGARLGVMPRSGGDPEVRWIEIDPCYVFHPMNAYDDEGRVVMDVVRYPDLWKKGGNDFPASTLWRWTVDADAGTATEAQIDDRPIEFPRLDERRAGLPYRYGYALETITTLTGGSQGVLRYDLETGATDRYEVGPGRGAAEPVFVPAGDGSAEDEGWIMTYVYDAGREASDFVILDASDPGAVPVATVPLPQRVPVGFHGSWIAAS
ncbi:MAG: carotenoid oxygenase family protein [Candidatus Rokuibacteriota bacterium]